MNEKHLVLDFNDKNMKLSLTQVARYDIDAIYDNIDRFKRFMTENIVSDCFQKVFDTNTFQLLLLDKSTSTLEMLTTMYNTIAENELIGEKLPALNNKQISEQLRIRGFIVKRTTVRENGLVKGVTRVYKEQEIRY